MSKEPMVQRVVRVPEALWESAKERAAAEGETVSDVIRQRLEKYAPPPKPEGDLLGLKAFLASVRYQILAETKSDVELVIVGSLAGEPHVWSLPTDASAVRDYEPYVDLARGLASEEDDS